MSLIRQKLIQDLPTVLAYATPPWFNPFYILKLIEFTCPNWSWENRSAHPGFSRYLYRICSRLVSFSLFRIMPLLSRHLLMHFPRLVKSAFPTIRSLHREVSYLSSTWIPIEPQTSEKWLLYLTPCNVGDELCYLPCLSPLLCYLSQLKSIQMTHEVG